MKKLFDKYITKNNLVIFSMLLVVLYPVIELDYLAYEFLGTIGLPRFTTIVRFLILPILAILLFYKFETNKKRFICISLLYGFIFSIYFILHLNNATSILENGRYPENYYFLLSDEIIYFVTLLMPLLYTYYFKLMKLNEIILKKVVLLSSSIISLPILISNILLISKSTYFGLTIDNIFSWFSLPYNDTVNHPRFYAGKFFFDEGNALGVIMLVTLPFLYYFFLRSNNKKDKITIGLLTFVHSLAMIILSSRVATYGVLLIPAILIVIYIFLIIIKEEKLNKLFICFTIVLIVINACIIPFSPAYNNMKFDSINHGYIMMEETEREKADDYRKGGEELEPFTKEWVDFYAYMFETYSYMIGVTPPKYYKEWYSYKYDPKFWVDLIFDYHLYDRINGRQIQQIWTNYKYEPLTNYQKIMGMGYSTIMRGSIVLERDFKQQIYTLGYLGFSLTMLPWIIIGVYLSIKLLLGYKQGKWNMLNIILMMVFCFTIIVSYMSGHIMDEYSSSLLLAIFTGILLYRLSKNTNTIDNK